MTMNMDPNYVNYQNVHNQFLDNIEETIYGTHSVTS